MKTKLSSIVALLVCLQSFGQTKQTEIEVQPYLQDAEPHQITIMWQTNQGEESIVEWGLSSKLGTKTKGTSFDINYTEKRIHEVRLKKLKRFTTYYYRVRTGNAKSAVFQFKTPPFVHDEKDFSILAMSDMQFDYREPEKFHEIVNQGVLQSLDGNLEDNLAMVIIPGDLVENGAIFHQWKDHFFDPAQKLFNRVPVYPILGNHEYNSDYYFKYFSLPKNGSPEYAEHWWYKDYGNTRIIGLNSNKLYRDLKPQILWLTKLLEETSKNKDIDFVFAQLHHPAKSEMWIPGETEFSSQIVTMLEQFTETSGKPSIHFFGHSHAYSRGQSKNHKHLMVNVATAGGAVDSWGKNEGKDYEEFSISEDEYGFVIVAIDGDRKNPKFTVKRISRGNALVHKNNELSDSITVYKNGILPNVPKAVFPKNETIHPKDFSLKAAAFSSTMTNAIHGASQWQIATASNFEKPVFDSWKQFENWYFKENRQKNDDLTDERVYSRLQPNTAYYWRVRYRDQHLNWSPWSATTSFNTSEK